VEPVGKNQTIMLHAVRGLNGHPIEMVLDQAVDTMDRGTSAQDQRRTGAKRALQRLQTLGLVEIRDDKVFVTEFK
jgi:hypothetical protein